MLFDNGPRFTGLPERGFDLFALPDRENRRRAIVATIHPALAALGEDLVAALSPAAASPLHAHLPRLDWPRDYEPFCTWLALSRETQGYQSGSQLNVGVHSDHVTLRLGWDVTADAFGRFEFLCRLGGVGKQLVEVAADAGLQFRVFAAAPWPQGSKCVFCHSTDLSGSFAEVDRRGVWWELGARFDLPRHLALVCSAELGVEAARIFHALLPTYDRIAGDDR